MNEFLEGVCEAEPNAEGVGDRHCLMQGLRRGRWVTKDEEVMYRAVGEVGESGDDPSETEMKADNYKGTN